MIYTIMPGGYTPYVATVGENVTRIRKAKKMTQSELADRLKVRQPSAWKIEQATNPKASTLLEIANALECSVEDLLEGVDADYTARAKARVTHPDIAGVVKGGAPKTQPSEEAVRASTVAVHSSSEVADPLGIAYDILKHTTTVSALAESLVRQLGPQQPSGAPARGSSGHARAAGVHEQTHRRGRR